MSGASRHETVSLFLAVGLLAGWWGLGIYAMTDVGPSGSPERARGLMGLAAGLAVLQLAAHWALFDGGRRAALGRALLHVGALGALLLVYRASLAVQAPLAGVRACEVERKAGVEHHKHERLAEAEAAFERAAAHDPGNPVVLVQLGRVRDAKQPGDGEAAYRRALALDPDYLPAYGWLAVTLEERGDVEGARALLRTAIARAGKGGVRDFYRRRLAEVGR